MLLSGFRLTFKESDISVIGTNYNITVNGGTPTIRAQQKLTGTVVGNGRFAKLIAKAGVYLGYWKKTEVLLAGRRVEMLMSKQELVNAGSQVGMSSRAAQAILNAENGVEELCHQLYRQTGKVSRRAIQLEESDLDLSTAQAHALAMRMLRATDGPQALNSVEIGSSSVTLPFKACLVDGNQMIVLSENELGYGMTKRVFDATRYFFTDEDELKTEELADLRIPSHWRQVAQAENDLLMQFAGGNVQPPAVNSWSEDHWFLPFGWGATYHMIVPKMDHDADKLVNGTIELSHEEKVNFITDIAHGIRQLHEAGFVHRDFKPDNCGLFGSTGRVIDLGCAVREGEEGWPGNAMCGAPEIWNESPLAQRLAAGEDPRQVRHDVFGYLRHKHVAHRSEDMWALGIFMLDLFTGLRKDYHQGENPNEVIRALQHRYGAPNMPTIEEAIAELPEELRPIVSLLLQRSPEERMTAEQLTHALDLISDRGVEELTLSSSPSSHFYSAPSE